MMYAVGQLGYLVASALYIFALHWMNTPATARHGVFAGVAATSIAVLVTWAQPGVVHHGWIVIAKMRARWLSIFKTIVASNVFITRVLAAQIAKRSQREFCVSLIRAD